MKILILDGHPNDNSLVASMARKYLETATQKGHEVQLIAVRELAFSPNLNGGFGKGQELEPALVRAQELLKWADHSVWIYPNWWGTFPALLKGFIDRTFLPGFAFKYKGGGFPEQLLKGKTAQIIMTLDTPIWFYYLFMRAPGLKIMKSGILGYCGIKVNSIKLFGPIRGTSASDREKIVFEIPALVRS